MFLFVLFFYLLLGFCVFLFYQSANMYNKVMILTGVTSEEFGLTAVLWYPVACNRVIRHTFSNVGRVFVKSYLSFSY